MPLAPTLQVLNLGHNKLGGMISDEIVTFTKLTWLSLANMGLEGAFVLNQFGTEIYEPTRRHHPGVHQQPHQPDGAHPGRKQVGG